MKKTLIIGAILAAVLTGCAPSVTPSPAPTAAASASPAATVSASPEASPSPSQTTEPVSETQLQDGAYKIEVSSSSSMFRVVDARLTVTGGEMSAVLTLSGEGYEKLYIGTGEEALADTDDNCVYFVKDAEGKYTYEIPVAALDADINCAAWSIRKQEWYDRILVFQSATLTEAPPAERLPADGAYTAEVTLSGGSGRASVESPAKLTITDGKAAAVIVWSSPNYDLMRIDGVEYAPVNTGGNSAFEIPVLLDTDMEVTARTVAMSTPRDIDYILRFDSATLIAAEDE